MRIRDVYASIVNKNICTSIAVLYCCSCSILNDSYKAACMDRFIAAIINVNIACSITILNCYAAAVLSKLGRKTDYTPKFAIVDSISKIDAYIKF